MPNYCKDCGIEISAKRQFCSKNCATSYRNWIKVQDGTHNLLSQNGGSENAIRHNNEMVEQGIHPFLSGNMSEDSLELKSEGIRKARLKESSEGNHPWQSLSSRINNEYSRSLSVIDNKGYKDLILYISDCEFSESIKIGWTSNDYTREFDNRTHSLSNLNSIRVSDSYYIVKLEYDIKLNFCTEEYFSKFNSTEIFPKELKSDIIKFINNY